MQLIVERPHVGLKILADRRAKDLAMWIMRERLTAIKKIKILATKNRESFMEKLEKDIERMFTGNSLKIT